MHRAVKARPSNEEEKRGGGVDDARFLHPLSARGHNGPTGRASNLFGLACPRQPDRGHWTAASLID